MSEHKSSAIFAAGCFWGVEQTFREVEGVVETSVGYTGGNIANPTYEQVCAEITGHAEAVEIHFDPERVTFEELLDVFWHCHDPTTLNRQGPDVGRQYRSAIYYLNEAQREAAEKSVATESASGKYQNPIVTEIVAATEYWPAEEYHQRYVEKQRAGTWRFLR